MFASRDGWSAGGCILVADLVDGNAPDNEAVPDDDGNAPDNEAAPDDDGNAADTEDAPHSQRMHKTWAGVARKDRASFLNRATRNKLIGDRKRSNVYETVLGYNLMCGHSNVGLRCWVTI